jgi:flavin reductase (DIM6/NTAB) family NADH-FMN oxidoreductase RutF
MAVTNDEFRKGLSRFVSGVTVVTCKADSGYLGLTVSAFSSVSLDPPLVLVCVHTRSSAHDALKEGRCFAVNILAEDQEPISRLFASKNADRFRGVGSLEGQTGAPLIEGTLAFVECRIVHAYPGGDHTILVGQVEAFGITERKPLLYFCGSYAQLG